MNRVSHVPGLVRSDSVAGLVSRFEDTEPSAAMLQHFRHKRKPIQAASFIQAGKDLIRAPHFGPVPGTISQFIHSGSTLSP